MAAPTLTWGRSARSVNVLYAGSLVNLVEHGLGPAFNKATGGDLQGFAGGSNALANQIKGRLRQGDVFISANPKINEDLMGPAAGDWVRWYVAFASSPLVIGYNASSRFSKSLAARPWFAVLQEPGIRIGRTDPKLDPKGKLTLELFDRAEQVYKLPGLAKRVLGAPDNPEQVRPEENLVGRLQSGQIDVGFFYSTETTDLRIPSLPLPPEVSLGARYTATVLRDAPNPAGAASFLAFLLGAEGRQIMTAHGLTLIAPALSGDVASVPERLKLVLQSGR